MSTVLTRTEAGAGAAANVESATVVSLGSERWLRRRLRELCEIDSTTGREARLLPAVTAMLEELGAKVRLQEVDGDRANVLATWAPLDSVRLLLSTHLDTVPPFLSPTPRPSGLAGRGTCDAKGQIVAQLGAIRRLIEAGERRIAWLGVVAEETDSRGAKKAIDLASLMPSLEAVVNGEPTGNRLPAGQKGFLHLELRCYGRRAHGGDPQVADSRLGENALWRLHDWLEAMRFLGDEDADFGPEVLNLGIVRGGDAANVVAGTARAEVVVRTVPGSTFLQQCSLLAPAGGELRVFSNDPPLFFSAPEGWPENRRAPAVGFGSDAPRLVRLLEETPWQDRIFMIGPGEIERAHTDDEFLDWGELRDGVEAITELSRCLLAPSPSQSTGSGGDS